MSVACAAELCGRFLWECDTSNKPLEWAGRLQLSASPPQAPCLPLRGSVSWSEQSQVLCIGLGALNDCYLSCQCRFEYEPQI
jgi:hypothetical protein